MSSSWQSFGFPIELPCCLSKVSGRPPQESFSKASIPLIFESGHGCQTGGFSVGAWCATDLATVGSISVMALRILKQMMAQLVLTLLCGFEIAKQVGWCFCDAEMATAWTYSREITRGVKKLINPNSLMFNVIWIGTMSSPTESTIEPRS